MFFDTSISGVNAAAGLMNIAGNNVANSSTVGFKGATANFSAMLSGSVGAAAGAQTFNQGVIAASTNTTDLAINGNGFFRTIEANNTVSYTRNGQFSVNNVGNLVNASGAKLTDIAGAPIVINNATTSPAKASTTITASQYLDPNLPIINQTTTPFSTTNPQSYSAMNSVQAYDNLGNVQNVQVYYVNNGANNYSVYSNTQTNPTPVALGSITINPITGQITTAAPAATTPATVISSGATLPPTFSGVPINAANNSFVTLNLAAVTQVLTGVPSTMTTDGNPVGLLNSFNIGSDGFITGAFSNSQTLKIGQQVGLVNFASPSGLLSTGRNSWTATAASGAPLNGTPSSSGFGSIQSSALEGSNVDMTVQLVDLLSAQRAYQANSQVIKAQDQALQTITSLR